jgi:uncharacterized membrane protein
MYQLSVWLHILGAMVWVGGMLFLALVMVPVARRLPPGERAVLLAAIGQRFRLVGWLSLLLILLTGLVISGYRGVTGEAVATGALLASPWGRLFAAKMGLVAIMVALTLIHDLALGPASSAALARGEATRTGQTRRLAAIWTARLSALLAMAVVALAVGLVRGWP